MIQVKRVPAFREHEDDQPKMVDGVTLLRATMMLIQGDMDPYTLLHRNVKQRDIRGAGPNEIPDMNHLMVMLARDRINRSRQRRGEVLVDLCFQDAICRSYATATCTAASGIS